jgi:para-aminobenzoate synthetase component 1
MIVDLLRNDLGRVSEFGSVQVAEPRTLEQHPTVWHTVATIQSKLRPDATLADLLRSTLPGGSITGAPKIRACQIINELEEFPRALYCGNIGVIGPRARSLALNIAIRTILMTGRHARIYAGAGIVADSDPALEYEETLHKAAAMLRALGVSESVNK